MDGCGCGGRGGVFKGARRTGLANTRGGVLAFGQHVMLSLSIVLFLAAQRSLSCCVSFSLDALSTCT